MVNFFFNHSNKYDVVSVVLIYTYLMKDNVTHLLMCFFFTFIYLLLCLFKFCAQCLIGLLPYNLSFEYSLYFFGHTFFIIYKDLQIFTPRLWDVFSFS